MEALARRILRFLESGEGTLFVIIPAILLGFFVEKNFAALMGLVWYAWLTRGIYNEATTERELSQKPILMPYIRDISHYSVDEKRKIERLGNFRINGGEGFLFKVRNVGKGPALNLRVIFLDDYHINSESGDELEIKDYQNRFLAPEPKGDEQAIQIGWSKRNQGINLIDLKGVKIRLICTNINGRSYEYDYQIIDPEALKIEYLMLEKLH